MAFDTTDLTFVMQGGLDPKSDVRYTADYMRSLFHGSKFILATQEGNIKRLSDYGNFDDVILTTDPGPLPPVKFGGEPHNVNRQIVTSVAGLSSVQTKYAVKMRTDAYLSTTQILDYWTAWATLGRGQFARGSSRILTVSLYTLNPRYDERIPFHVSDWLHFGETRDVLKMWSCPSYDFGTATYYQREDHLPGSLPREVEFRARFATEQWLALHYLFDGIKNFPIQRHNDCTEDVARLFEEYLADNFIVVHPYDIGLIMPKHRASYKSRYANLRNYSFNDWKGLIERDRGVSGPLNGYSAWPRTELQKALYMVFRRKRFVKRRERRV